MKLIKSIPNSISLNEFNTAPLQKVVKHNEKVEITPGTIWVKGVTVNEDDLIMVKKLKISFIGLQNLNWESWKKRQKKTNVNLV
ncbi:hypothetical protein [Flavobacterium jumunjinense]|uniref:hypothetical protein n=1 Tax=Flavobacterium jumunjinense TaxID=998845 RepID=UPI001F22CA2F|nr:hypothetical protein [Flavobacterium jumunjinense]